MSVYSGFATRQQEKKYNDYIMTLLSVVLKRMLKFYAGEPCDEQKFKDLLQNICERMITLEQGKFLEPKYSGLLLDTLQTLESLFGNAFFQKEGEFSHTFLDLKDLPNPKIKMNTIDDPPEVVTKQDYDRSYRKGISNMAVTNLVETNRKIKTIDSPSCGSLKKHSVVSSDNEEEMLRQRTFYGGRLYRDRVREASKDRGEMIRMG